MERVAIFANNNNDTVKTIIREIKEELEIDIINYNIIKLYYLLYDNLLRYMFY